jgi:hypothetical protein
MVIVDLQAATFLVGWVDTFNRGTERAWIWVRFLEPDQVPEAGATIEKHGPLDQNFVKWLQSHYEFWDKHGGRDVWMEQIMCDPAAHQGLKPSW